MKFLKLLVVGLIWPGIAAADGYVMGSGRWNCGDAVSAYESGAPSQQGQLAGWIMGFWSAATFERETKFVDIVENVGAEKIVNSTLAECRKSPNVSVHRVVRSMIENTK
ncbi:MAG: 5'-methylthioadenosine phosphorylase [Rhodobacteraceae bacterium]|nr:5'-methylthioadenosine phosphorylase [Paracoccaceae bacterium]